MTKLQSWFCCSLFFFAACALDEDSGAVEDFEAALPQREGESPDIGGVQAPCCRPNPPGVRSSDTSAPLGDEPDISGTRPGGTPPVPQGLLGEPMAGDAPDISGTRPPGAPPVPPGAVAR